MKQISKRLTYANVVSSIALFLVLGGATAFAAKKITSHQLKANSVTTAKIKKNAVTATKIKKNAVTTDKIKNEAVTGAKVNESTLGTVPSATTAASANALAGYSHKGIVRVNATGGVSKGAAAAAAPEIAFFSAGPFTVYAKCLVDTVANETIGVFYIKTSQAGAILDSDEDSLDGDPVFLDPSTLEEDRELAWEDASENGAGYYGMHSPEFAAMAPDGTVVKGDVQVAVKNGTLAGGNGIYGGGNVCLFAGGMNVLNG